MPECRNWQTNRTQNPAHFTVRVGSSPTSGTKPWFSPRRSFCIFVEILMRSERQASRRVSFAASLKTPEGRATSISRLPIRYGICGALHYALESRLCAVPAELRAARPA